MNQKIPKTPFATRLSGDAKETELRIRSIFSGKKLRPPVWMFTLIVLVMLGCIGLVSCKTEKDNLWVGLNARIVEIDTEQMILYIQDIDENANVFGQRCALDCKQAAQEERLIFVDYETHEVTDISFYEFQVGDEIIIELYSSQKDDAKDNTARAEQVQLGTQRPIDGELTETAEGYDDFFHDTVNSSVMNELFTASNISDVNLSPEGKLLVAPAGEGHSFCAAYFTERDNYELVIGIWDSETGGLVGTPFRAANSGGTPKVAAYEWDGQKRLIYTANGMNQSFSRGQAGEIHLVDGEMTWVWPVQGDIRDLTRDDVGQPYNKYLEYWENHLALMSANGLDVFVENEKYGSYEGSPQQWFYYGSGTTYHMVSRYRLDEYDMEQVRTWLEEFGRDGNNARNLKNDSASWRILALERSELHKKCTLLCVSEYDETVYLRAVLNMDHEKDRFQRKQLEVLDWEIETSTAEAILEEAKGYNRRSTKRDRLIREYVKILYPHNQIYFMESLDEEIAPGYTAITEIEPMGNAALDEDTIGAVYRVTVQISFSSMHAGTQAKFDHTVVLSCNNNMTFNGILGGVEDIYGLSIQEIVQQAGEGEYELEMSLWHEGDPNLVPVRLGEWNEAAFANVLEAPVVNILDGWEPIYWPGDYWDQYTREGISALRYHHADGDYFSAFTIDVTRNDFITQRGIRVGDTREAVKAAYLKLKAGDYWGKYSGEDYLWYCEDANDFGPALIFFFENDKVSRIILNNMFN